MPIYNIKRQHHRFLVNTLSYKSLDMYPIGSVYTSTINTDPKELFGGEWKTIDNNNNTVIYMWERIS